MRESIIISFIFGLSVMFFWMTAWLFFRKGGRLSVLVASLMVLLGMQCFISLWFLIEDVYLDPRYWPVITSIDIVAVPLYALILRELVRPGSVTLKVAAINVLPFAVTGIVYVITGLKPINWFMIFSAGVYGTSYLIWTNINIRKYNRRLKEQYSYTEKINLGWLHKILWIFFALLAIWTIDTLAIHANTDCFYLLASIVMWMVIDYSIYRHETIMDSLTGGCECHEANSVETTQISDLGSRVCCNFISLLRKQLWLIGRFQVFWQRSRNFC